MANDHQADILRSRVRVGFTPDQAGIALGAPQHRVLEETAHGTTEVWTYRDYSIRFKAGRVVSVQTIE